MNYLTETQEKLFELLKDELPEKNLPFCLTQNVLKGDEVAFYKINALGFDEEFPHREAFQNVLKSFENDAFKFIYILDGQESEVNLYVGVVKNKSSKSNDASLNAVDYGKIIKGAFDGNFSGSKLERAQGDALDDLLLKSVSDFKNAGAIIGVPSVSDDKENGGKYGFQGMDRLINGMLGCRFRLIVVSEAISKAEILNMKNNVYEIYDELSKLSKLSVQQSKSEGESVTNSENESIAEGTNWSENKSVSDSSGRQSEKTNSSHQTQKGSSFGESNTKTTGKGKSIGKNFGESTALTYEIISKKAQEKMKYIDDELLNRINIGNSQGMFKTSVYYMGKNPTDAGRLKASLLSMLQGSSSIQSPLRAVDLDMDRLKSALVNFEFLSIESDATNRSLALFSHPVDSDYNNNYMGLSTYLTPKEVSLIAGLPQKEIPGIAVKESVDFGLNPKKIIKNKGDNKEITLGNIMQKGREISVPVTINKDIINKHIFVAGVTGAGKTTTCHKFLKEADTPFLVIDPAKTEYRELIKSKDFSRVVVFTAGDESTAPFWINPFECVEGESISSHIDMLKATFTSAFEMEASMPQIIEEAILKVYEDKGFDVNMGKFGREFPILSDFLKALEDIVESKGFSNRLRDDYRGTLISRFSNLTKGAKGRIFNCRKSINFEKMMKGRVVIELENLKSAEDKALLMGFILSRIYAVIKKFHERDDKFRHITLIEEAHRLLTKPEYGDSGAKKSAVETFTDLLAEVRNYGESLVIVDQIPNKLAPEVLKNTNTKIIHKLFARDDKEAVGDTMLMNDKQKEFLSALEVGEAIVFTEGMALPVHVKIEKATDTGDNTPSNAEVRERFLDYYGDQYLEREFVSRFYSPTLKVLKIVADDVMTNWNVNNETAEKTMKLRENMDKFIKDAEDEFDIVEGCKVLSLEFRKNLEMSELFQIRLEEFLQYMLDVTPPPADLFRQNNMRLMLDDFRHHC